MQTWPVQDAKARFSEFLDTCLAHGPQMVTKRGTEAAVLVSVDEWRRLQDAARPSLKQLLLSDQARGVLVLPPRGRARRRAPQVAGLNAECTCSTPTSFLNCASPSRMGAVLAWFGSLSDAQIHLSAVSLGEIQAGIELTREQDPAKALELEAWLHGVAAAYNVLPMGRRGIQGLGAADAPQVRHFV